MSRSSLSQFPQGFFQQGFSSKPFSRPASKQGLARVVAEHFPHANREFRRVKKMVLDTDIKGKSRRKTRIRPGSIVSLRRFRRLFAVVQSSASSKLSNPLINQRFLVLARSPAGTAARPIIWLKRPPKL
jgi:hypothetical protein